MIRCDIDGGRQPTRPYLEAMKTLPCKENAKNTSRMHIFLSSEIFMSGENEAKMSGENKASSGACKKQA